MFFKRKKISSNLAFIAGSSKTMEQAAEFARQNIDVFWNALNSGNFDPDGFAIKVGFHHDDEAEVSVEHIWVAAPSKMPEGFQGILGADSFYSDKLKQGQPVGFFLDDITDWQYTDQGKAIGHFSTRVLLQDMSSSEQKSILKSLKWKTLDG